MSFVCFVGSPYLIGIDGGGSKTELILVEAASGEIVARHVAPGSNPSHVGPEKARAIVHAALAVLLDESKIEIPKSKISATHLYMAGSPAFWREVAGSMEGFGHVIAAPDALPVVELATEGLPGLVLHGGTGSFVAARTADGATHYAGGLGWKFGDPGSGFDIARRAVASALLELQGWAEPTEISAAVRAHTGLADAATITRFFYDASDANARLAAFAPRVIELAEQGVRPAQVALAGSLAELVALARPVTLTLFPGEDEIPCGVSGAVLTNDAAKYALIALAHSHGWPVRFRFVAEPPIEGVRRLLLKSRTGL